MSFFDIVESDFNTLSANSEFAVSVVQHATGDLLSGGLICGSVWIEDQPTRTTEHGEQTVRTGTLRVPPGVTVGPQNQWMIAGELWQTLRATNQVQGGFKECYLQRNDKQNVKGRRGPLL